MQRILILGGGVGGTLTANLLVKKLRARIDRGEVEVHGRRCDRPARLPAGLHVHRDGRRTGREPPAPGALPPRQAGDARRGRGRQRWTRCARSSRWPTASRSATTTWSWPPARASSPRRSNTSTPRPTTSTPPRRAAKLRAALDAFDGGRIVIGIAGMPYKCPPAPLEVAFLIESELRDRKIRDRTTIDFCSPIGRAFTIESVSDMATPILETKGIELHTFFNVEAIDPERKVVQSLEGEELPYDLLILVPPHKGQQFLMDSGLAPAPGGWLPTDRHTLLVGDRANVYALGDATDLPLSKAGSTAHFEAPVVAERIVAAVEGRDAAGKHADYEGKVMCFFEIGDGKGTLLQFDYEHPPRPPKPNQLWHLGKIVFNKTYWHTVPKGRV